MKEKILITYGSAYDMVTEEGDRLKGCTVQYFFFGDKGNMFNVQKDVSVDDAIGYKVMKSSIPYEERQYLISVPGIYEGEFEMSVNAQMKPVLKLQHVEYVEALEVSSLPVDAFGDAVQPAAKEPENKQPKK